MLAACRVLQIRDHAATSLLLSSVAPRPSFCGESRRPVMPDHPLLAQRQLEQVLERVLALEPSEQVLEQHLSSRKKLAGQPWHRLSTMAAARSLDEPGRGLCAGGRCARRTEMSFHLAKEASSLHESCQTQSTHILSLPALPNPLDKSTYPPPLAPMISDIL